VTILSSSIYPPSVFVCFNAYCPNVERDSWKDQLIVVLFLIITTGLLIYALIRPYVQSWLAVRRSLNLLICRELPRHGRHNWVLSHMNMRRYLLNHTRICTNIPAYMSFSCITYGVLYYQNPSSCTPAYSTSTPPLKSCSPALFWIYWVAAAPRRRIVICKL
jgi:hypothetical protein